MWRLADYRISEQLFELRDDSGVCRIDPRGAEVFAASRHVVVQHGHKYIEDVLFADSPVYVLGDLDTGSQINTEAEIHQDAGKLITQLKQSKVRLLQQFDLNRDGEIDMHEWELARERAYAEARAKHAQRLETEVHLIAKPANKRLFLISGISPHALRKHYQRWAWIHFSLFCLAVVLSILIGNLAS
jgi:cation diffusion facilitator CzcD-associated flavoprotein CzcO